MNALVYMNLLIALNIAYLSSRGEKTEASQVWKHLKRVLAGAWRLALRKGTGETRKSSTAKQSWWDAEVWGWKEERKGSASLQKRSVTYQALQGQRKLSGNREGKNLPVIWRKNWSKKEGGEPEHVRRPCSKLKELFKVAEEQVCWKSVSLVLTRVIVFWNW